MGKRRKRFRRYDETTKAATDAMSAAASMIKLATAVIRFVIVMHGWR